MIRKKIVLSVLLFLMGFSLVHEYYFAAFDEGHSSVGEYIQELESPSDHKDLCDIHYEYHLSYILPQKNAVTYETSSSAALVFSHKRYDFEPKHNFFKPPIA